MGQLQQSSERGIVGWRKSQLFDDEQPAILRQDTYDRGFPMLHRHDRDANVDIGTPGPQPRGAILREPTFRDVEVGDNLDARNDGLRQHAGRRRYRPQQAVDAHADHQPGVEGLDVNVARAKFYGLLQQIIDSANHGRAAGKIPQTFNIVFARLVRIAVPQLDVVAAQTLI